MHREKVDFDEYEEFGRVQKYIEKSTKKSLIDDLSKRLLKLEFKSNHSIKSKCLKWIVEKKYYLQYKVMKNVRPIKTGKKIGTTYKDYTHNFKPQEVKITNKVPREKSNCFVCRSSKSRFLKQKCNDKK